MTFRVPARLAFTSLAVLGLALAAPAQAADDSVGFGWPMADQEGHRAVGAGSGGAFGGEAIAARNGEVPEGVEALERDIFTSDDFYQDADLWSDPRYFRCNSPMGLESQWGAYGNAIIGDTPPGSGAWGYCDADYPREDIVSPYPFESAQEHYEALMAEAVEAGATLKRPAGDLPDWDGVYNDSSENWFWGRIVQATTILSLLTPDYQQRFVQEAYHHANTNAAMWPSQYCWPEGFLRRWHEHSVRDHQVLMNPNVVQILTGVADNFLTQIRIGDEFTIEDGSSPRLGQAVPRWYGETIGFWNGDNLITWTSNIQGWMTHGGFEHSNLMQTIEIYSPERDDAGELIGLRHETIFYDPEALVEPIRMDRVLERLGDYQDRDPYIFVECNPTIYPIDGRGQPVSPGQVIEYVVPDWFGRPWAQMWERFHEQDMERPQGEALFGF
ncbi:MAG TPA: hypothetical protein VNS12_01535 [Pelagibacterium sp.]|uniref:hypothetical protein n=1 Tax=Pelagibacterium sp. TaxID=1967288 RepID=UPI002C945CD6|nr:hypothetical protein [Pelagibacterium sp.]HWJ86738.1 hypothetical protein [Pelagibacterium sp.]